MSVRVNWCKGKLEDLYAVESNDGPVGVRHHEGVVPRVGDHAARDQDHAAAHRDPAGVEQVRAHVEQRVNVVEAARVESLDLVGDSWRAGGVGQYNQRS